jgi:hypothetical protein
MSKGESGRVAKRGTMSERNIADFWQGHFKAEGSRGEALLREFCPDGDMTRRSLYTFASLLASVAGVPLSRDLTRRRDLLVKWVDDNCDALRPYLSFFRLTPE